MSELPLFRRFPRLQERIPRLSIGDFPTPVERWLGGDGGGGDLWAKRDDLTAPLFGGNKVRTLEFALAPGIEAGRPLLVCAPVGSSWAAACAYYGRAFGAEVDLVQFRHPRPEVTEPNASVAAAYGRHRISCATPLGIPLRVAALWLRTRARPPMILPLGGSSPSTVLGYASAALELDGQVRAGQMPRPEVIFVPFGSGGTAAGLIIGMGLLRWPTKVVAVRVTDAILANRWHLRRLVRGGLGILRRAGVPAPGVDGMDWEVEGRFFGGRYGRPTPEGREAARILAEREGIELDLTYSAKAAAALLARIREGTLRGRTVLFWHTHNSRDLRVLLGAESEGAFRWPAASISP